MSKGSGRGRYDCSTVYAGHCWFDGAGPLPSTADVFLFWEYTKDPTIIAAIVNPIE